MAAWRVVLAPFVLLLAAGPALGLGLTAGDVDDHLNWDDYLDYLDGVAGRQGQAQDGPGGLPDLRLEGRVTLRLVDPEGEPVPFGEVWVGSEARRAGADGIVRLFPAHDGFEGGGALEVGVAVPGGDLLPQALDLGEGDDFTIALPEGAPQAAALDLLVVMDTTGSMGDELRYLTDEFQAIVDGIAATGVDARFGLTLYRDAGDEYVVRQLGFTSSVQEMQGWLAAQSAAGGGDYPEAMDQAIGSILQEAWRDGPTARVVLLVADAPPHADGYGDFVDAALAAREEGIHVHPVAASGVAGEAEYLMRGAAALTQGRYMFLTDDSGLGNSHAEPSIPCYVVTELKDLVVRVVNSEVEGRRIEAQAGDVLREVGHYERGVCLSDPQPQEQEPPEDEATLDETDGTGGDDEAPAPGMGEGEALVAGSHGDTGAPTGEAWRMYAADTDGAGGGDGAGASDESSGVEEKSSDAKRTPGVGAGLLALAALLLAGVAAQRGRGGRT